MAIEWEITTTVEEQMPDLGVVGEIEYTAPYALYIEFDTDYTGAESTPPFDPIYEWVKEEWAELGKVKEAAKKNMGDDVDEDTLKEAVTWIIINNMDFQEGIHFGKRAMDHGKQKAEMIANVHKKRQNPYELMAENIVEVMAEHSQGTIEAEAKSSEELKNSMSWDLRREDV